MYLVAGSRVQRWLVALIMYVFLSQSHPSAWCGMTPNTKRHLPWTSLLHTLSSISTRTHTLMHRHTSHRTSHEYPAHCLALHEMTSPHLSHLIKSYYDAAASLGAPVVHVSHPGLYEMLTFHDNANVILIQWNGTNLIDVTNLSGKGKLRQVSKAMIAFGKVLVINDLVHGTVISPKRKRIGSIPFCIVSNVESKYTVEVALLYAGSKTCRSS